DIYFAYTQTNFFQIYNGAQSRPFREINYMPELYAVRNLDWSVGPVHTELLGFGYVHQSNGKDLPASRSWDRLFFQMVATTGDFYWELKPWWRIPESRKTNNANSARRDDNPDIEKYMGHFELRITRPLRTHLTELMVRNNLRSDNRGAVQLDYTFPLKGRFKRLVQVFSGYGDSLINCNDYQNCFSIGILLTDTFYRGLNMQLYRHVVLFLAVLFITGCATHQLNLVAPEFSVSHIALQEIGLLEQQWDITLRAFNPNDKKLNIKHLSYELLLDDKRFARGSSQQNIVLR